MKIALALLAATLTYKKVSAASCFAEAQGYNCCKGCTVVFTDESGDWGVENNQWCGIPNTCNGSSSSECWSSPNYPCCSDGATVVYSDSDGNWGYENNQWCGIVANKVANEQCWSLPEFPCCKDGAAVVYEEDGQKWGIENNNWCGIKAASTTGKTDTKADTKTDDKNAKNEKQTTTADKTKSTVTSTDPVYNKDRKQSPYPEAKDECGSWALIDNVCCAEYCDNVESTQGCGDCGGHGSEHCKIMDSFACRSGDRGYDFHEIPNEYHYSRSTHFGLTVAGACGFGLYQICGTNVKYTGDFDNICASFCKAFPNLCKDPEGYTYRGNFAAPQGNYYTQFWGALEGDHDNYLSCGECFEVYKTKEDGTDYKPGEEGYTPPIILSVIDSCPCNANDKWCCGAEWDQCQEVKNFKYGCPVPKDSIHLDLSDVAMARLQSGKHDGAMPAGVIPNKYRRVPCPSLGNMYILLSMNAGPYWFSFTVVNSAGFGGIAIVEALDDNGNWVKMLRDPNYTKARPQERFGTWCTPQGSGPYNLPVDLRLTDGSGITVVAEKAIKSFDPPANGIQGYNYIDIGVNFPEIPIPDPE